VPAAAFGSMVSLMTPQTPAQRPWSLWVGWQDLTVYVTAGSIRLSDPGFNSPATLSFTVADRLNNVGTKIAKHQWVYWIDNIAARVLFGGFVRVITPTVEGPKADWQVECYDFSTVLDSARPVVAESVQRGTTDQDAIQGALGSYLYGLPWMGCGFIQSLGTIGPVLPSHTTLRNAIEQYIAATGVTGAVSWTDSLGYLHTGINGDAPAPLGITDNLQNQAATPSPIARVTIASGTGYRAWPGLARMSDGRLITTYRRGTDHATTTDGNLYCRISPDGGATWGAEQLIYDDASLDIRDSGITCLASGKLIVSTFTWNGSTTYAVKVITSSDNGGTWSAPVTVSTTFTAKAATTAAVLELTPGGTLLLPIYGQNTGDTQDTAAIVTSTDGGATWGNQKTIASAPSTIMYSETQVVRTQRGYLLALIRSDTSTSILRSISIDSGATWSAPTTAFGSATGRPGMIVTPAGVILCVFRPTAAPGTCDYRTSADDGITWTVPDAGYPGAGHLDNQGTTMEYAAMVAVPGGFIACLYALEISATESDLYLRNFIYLVPAKVTLESDGQADADGIYVYGGSPDASRQFGGGTSHDPYLVASLDNPDLTTSAAAQNAATIERAARNSAVRVTLVVTGYDGWAKGQTVQVTSVVLALVSVQYVISAVDTEVMSGTGIRRYTITCGYNPVRYVQYMRAALTKNRATVGAAVAGAVGGTLQGQN